MKQTDAAAQFNRLFNDQRQAAQGLLDLLLQEYGLLNGNDAAGLEPVSELKQQALTALGALTLELDTLLQTLGCTADRAGIDACLRQTDADGRHDLAVRWHALTQLLQQCQRQNTINGIVIELRHRSVQQVLGALTGQTATQTYDPRGLARTNPHSYTLAKA